MGENSGLILCPPLSMPCTCRLGNRPASFLCLTSRDVAKVLSSLAKSKSAGIVAGPRPRHSDGSSPLPMGATSTSLSTIPGRCAVYRKAWPPPQLLPMMVTSAVLSWAFFRYCSFVSGRPVSLCSCVTSESSTSITSVCPPPPGFVLGSECMLGINTLRPARAKSRAISSHSQTRLGLAPAPNPPRASVPKFHEYMPHNAAQRSFTGLTPESAATGRC